MPAQASSATQVRCTRATSCWEATGTKSGCPSRAYTANLTAYNLAVDGVHTYYVAVGDTSVLVHNRCEIEPAGGGEIKRSGENAPDYTQLPQVSPDSWQAITGPPREPPPVYWTGESNLGGPKWKRVLYWVFTLGNNTWGHPPA